MCWGLFSLQTTRGLILTLLLALGVQLLVLAALFNYRSKQVSEQTVIFSPDQLLDLAELGRDLEPQDLQTIADLSNAPNVDVRLLRIPPEPGPPLSWLDRQMGLQTRQTTLQLKPNLYLVLDRGGVLDEAYVFLGQVGFLILTFLVIVALILFRARAALLPVRRFAAAAERLSQNLHAAAMAERGGPEVVQATRAVNRMQTALQERVAERSRLIAGIGHDLRTYITRLTLRADLIEDPEQRAKALQDLQDMTQVVNQSLMFGQADQPTEDLEQVDLATFAARVAEKFEAFDTDLTLGTLTSVQAQIRPVALERALGNLIENALRYGGKTQVSLQVQKGAAHILIEDEGPGIPLEQRGDALKPFVRLEASRNRETGGTGLGLTIAKSLTEQQGGQLLLESAPTGGLRARLVLPLT